MKTSLENLPPELMKTVTKKIRWCMKEVQGGIEGCSIQCPKDPKHFMVYRWSNYHGMELVSCYECGYRFVMMKQNGKLVLVNQPEKKQLIIRGKR